MSSQAELKQQKLQQLLIAKLSPRMGVMDDASFGAIKEIAGEYVPLLEEKRKAHEQLKLLATHLPNKKDFWESFDVHETRRELLEKNISLVGLNERSLARIKKMPPALLDAYIDYVEKRAERRETIPGNKREEVALKIHGAIVDCVITTLATPPATREDYMVPNDYIEVRYAQEQRTKDAAIKKHASKSYGASIDGIM